MVGLDTIEDYLAEVQRRYPTMCERLERIYLVGADPFALSANRLDAVNDLYIGIETGLSDVLERLNKGNDAEEACEQVLRLNSIGMNHRDLLILGAAGKGRGREEALADAALENELKPDMILINTMSVFPGTALSREVEESSFALPGEKESLEEERLFIERLTLPETYFWAAHHMDATPIAGMLGTERASMLATLDASIATIDESKYHRVYSESRI